MVLPEFAASHPMIEGAHNNPLPKSPVSGLERARTLKQRTANPIPRRRRVANLHAPPARAQQAGDEFARFFAQSLDLLCIAGLDGYFKYLNPACSASLGW